MFLRNDHKWSEPAGCRFDLLPIECLWSRCKFVIFLLNTAPQALETFPRTLADNSGLKATEVVSELRAAHQEGKANSGVRVEVSRSAYVTAC